MKPLTKSLPIRPYARLLTMLGDQLIKDNQVALVELIKNAYDADATSVSIRFCGFGENWQKTPTSRIIIEDDGSGMDEETITKAWLNPATPNKKKLGDARKTEKGRVMQGEKGIGRFAMLKLGKKISMITRTSGASEECVATLDFSDYDEEFTQRDGQPQIPFLDELRAQFRSRSPEIFSKNKHGTQIVIEELKSDWTEQRAQLVSKDTIRLQPIFSAIRGKQESEQQKFSVLFFKDKKEITKETSEINKLRDLLDGETAVLKITDGSYDNGQNTFYFKLNGKERKLPIADTKLSSLKVFRDHFGDENFLPGFQHKPDCGPFAFSFYFFDLQGDPEGRHKLDKEEKEIIKGHRIYLYRDGIRVYPYGNPDDDWLEIDILRGTSKASAFPSNDQVVGSVDITHADNPALKDKTSREGLIEEGTAVEDFKGLLQSFLAYIRQNEYDKYRLEIQRRREQKLIAENKVDENIAVLLKHAQATGDKGVLSLARKVQTAAKAQQQIYERRNALTEDLAGVGLAVETSSHDLMLTIGRAYDAFDKLTSAAERRGEKCAKCVDDLQRVRGMLGFIENRMKSLQSLFSSSKQRPRSISVKETIEKVRGIYSAAFERAHIQMNVTMLDIPLSVRCTDAVLYQVFINLFDNSLYWLGDEPQNNRQVEIQIDGSGKQLIYADSGPGIPDENKPFVFEAFFSTKEAGRGLGLYIARQLLDRMGFSISLAEIKSDHLLKGANLVINFNAKEESK